jgi:hypothetical protein
MLSLSPSNVVLPAEKVDDMRSLLDAFRKLDESDFTCNLHPLKVNPEYPTRPSSSLDTRCITGFTQLNG